MIVDDLRAISPGFREITAGAQVIRVPWQVCPLTQVPDGKWGLRWTGFSEEMKRLVPSAKAPRHEHASVMNADGTAIDSSWWRLPFNRMVLVSDQAERGCLVIRSDVENESTAGKKLVQNYYQMNGAPITPDWTAKVELVALGPTGKPLVMLCLGAVSIAGQLGDMHKDRAVITALAQRRLDHGIESIYRASWTVMDQHIHDELTAMWNARPAELALDVGNILGGMALACAIMCCKNVDAEDVVQPERLQRARAKHGKLPLTSWKVLKVRHPAPRRRPSIAGGGGGEPLAIHWVRGHFKHFTPEKPLFGKAVGTYWWTPHLAGQADRVVLKDYELEESDGVQRDR